MIIRNLIAADASRWLLGLLLLFVFPQSIESQIESIKAAAYSDKPIAEYVPVLRQNVSIKGSRGEVLSLMLKINFTGCGRIKVAPFTRVDSRVGEIESQFFQMEKVRTSQPSFTGAFVGDHFDPLIPLRDNQLCLKQDREGWIWGDLKIPDATPAGVYHSTISFGEMKPVQVALTVWSMTIPEKPALPAYSELTAWFNLLGHYGRWTDQEAVLAQAYVSAMQEHRIAPIKLHIRRPPVEKGPGGDVLNIDSYPDTQQSFKSVSLRQRPQWALYDFPTVALEEIRNGSASRYFKAIENAIPIIGRDNQAFVYLWDEPGREDLEHVVEMAKLVRESAPSLKIMVTTPYYPQLSDYVDIFVPVMDQFAVPGFASPKQYRELQQQGKQVWWYVSCMSHGCDALMDSGRPDFVIDRPASYIRSIAWLSARYNIDAFLYYSVNNGYQFNPKRDPWRSLWDFSGNGDGTLFYPGRAGERGFVEHQPVASIRLKLWREASFDAEYLRWMNLLPEKPEWWEREFAAIAHSPQRWNRDYVAYSLLRERIGDFLDGINKRTSERGFK